MAYIIQQRRDIAENWKKINPVLARGEMGFIEDVDDNGIQKSSLYKMGDGKTAWNNLPLFGFGGNVYGTDNAWVGSDLDTSVASQQAVMDRIAQEILTAKDDLNTTIDTVNQALSQEIENIINGVDGDPRTEGLVDKVSLTQLVQSIYTLDNEFPEEATEEEKAAILAAQIISRATILEEFTKVWEKVEENEDRIDTLENTSDDHETRISELEDLTSTHSDEIAGMQESNTSKFGEIDSSLDAHEKFISGWTETIETPSEDPEGEPTIEEIKHKGVDEKIADVESHVTALDSKFTNMHQILSETDYAALDKTGFPDGTLFFTFKTEA